GRDVDHRRPEEFLPPAAAPESDVAPRFAVALEEVEDQGRSAAELPDAHEEQGRVPVAGRLAAEPAGHEQREPDHDEDDGDFQPEGAALGDGHPGSARIFFACSARPARTRTRMAAWLPGAYQPRVAVYSSGVRVSMPSASMRATAMSAWTAVPRKTSTQPSSWW